MDEIDKVRNDYQKILDAQNKKIITLLENQLSLLNSLDNQQRYIDFLNSALSIYRLDVRTHIKTELDKFNGTYSLAT